MKKNLLAALSLFLAGAMIFAFASCTSQSSTAATVEDLAYVTANGKMIIGITDFEPMDFQDADGKWTGFDAELAEKVCEKLGVEADFQLVDWTKKEAELNSKTIDCIWNGFTINDERKEEISFSQGYMLNKQVIVIRKDDADKYTDLASLTSAAFTAEGGSAGEDVLKNNDTLKDVTYIDADGQTDALKEVLAMTSDAAVIDYTMAKYLIEKKGGDFSNLAILDFSGFASDEYYGIGFRKGSDLTAKVDEILDEFQADGTITALAEKYELQDAVKDIK